MKVFAAGGVELDGSVQVDTTIDDGRVGVLLMVGTDYVIVPPVVARAIAAALVEGADELEADGE